MGICIDFLIGVNNSYFFLNSVVMVPLFNEFITQVIPLQGLNKSLQVDRRFKTYYKFTFPNGNEYYAPLEEIKKMAKGIVKKVIIDF